VFLNTTDRVDPDTVLDGGPSDVSLVRERRPSFSFGASESDARFVCQVDDQPDIPCSSPFKTKTLADGTHRFAVRAVDTSDNEDLSPANRTFTVDTKPPMTTLDSLPDLTTPLPRAEFVFSADEAATFDCRLDDEPWAPCTSPKKLRVSRATHTFRVRATDRAGNTQPVPTIYRWSVQQIVKPFRVKARLKRMRINGRRQTVLTDLTITNVGTASVQPICTGCKRLDGAIHIKRRKGTVTYDDVNYILTRGRILRINLIASNALGRYQTHTLTNHHPPTLKRKAQGCFDQTLQPTPCG
jgi:hypothetical protein